MKDVERNRFVNAVKKLNEGPRPTKWDHLAWIHNKYFNEIHFKNVFYAWHREYLSLVEKELMKIDSKVRIPYWNWTLFFNRTSDDPVFYWFGSTGKETNENDPKNLCVQDGPFNNFRVYYYSDLGRTPKEHCFTRNAVFSQVLSSNHSFIDKAIIDEKDPDIFWRRMEETPHADVHINIGEDFTNFANAADPLFILHHAFVDKVWYDRQMRYPELFNNYPGGDKTIIPYFNSTVVETFDTKAKCYDYKEDTFKWTRPKSSQNGIKSLNGLPEPEKFEPLVKNLHDTSVSDKEIQEHARKYLFKDVILPSDPNLKPGCPVYGPKVPTPVSYIKMMNMDQVRNRENMRMEILMMDQENRKCLK
jgi:hypothetical protein